MMSFQLGNVFKDKYISCYEKSQKSKVDEMALCLWEE